MNNDSSRPGRQPPLETGASRVFERLFCLAPFQQMKKQGLLLFLCIPLLYAGCSSAPEMADGYQFGDLTHMTARQLWALEKARREYCDKTKDSALRQLALVFIRSELPEMPEDGICTDLETAISEIDHLERAPTDKIDAKARDSPEP